MFFWRALLGVGEASYGVIAPALIADLFPPEKRGRAMGVYYLALPLGGRSAMRIGGWVGQDWGWPTAFFVVGLPGLLAALAGLVIIDPGRGASEGKSYAGKADRPRLSEYLELFKTPTFVFNTAGMAAVTFATGAYAAWGSTFYQTVRGMSMKEAGSVDRRALAAWPACSASRWARSWPTSRSGSPSVPICSWPHRSSPALFRSGSSASSTRTSHVARIALRGDDPAGHGARAVQHGHRQRRAGQPAGRGLRALHLPDPPVRRHQLAASSWGRSRIFFGKPSVAESPIGRFFAADRRGTRRPRPT